jgi:hypothetical protein
MTILRAVAIGLLTCAAGCGGCNSDDNNNTLDAFIIHDTAIDARVCGTATPGTLDFGAFDPRGYISWVAPLTGIGGGASVKYQFEFFKGANPLVGTYDLKLSDEANYATCSVCVHGFVVDPATGNITKHYFQSGGSFTLNEDPFTNKHLLGSLQNLQLEEVTIAMQTFQSTPVAGGECANFADYSVDHDRVPNAWTCTHGDYDNMTSCDCVCGAPDPDCTINGATVVGCTTAMPACFNDACVTPPTNDTCATAAAITIGTPVTGNTAGAQFNYSKGLDAATCTGYLQPGPDVVYTLDLAAAQAITVTLSGLAATYDGGISLVGPGDQTLCEAATISTCVAGADDKFAGQSETFTYTATTAGTYFIIVDGYTVSDGGAFTLTVTSP